MKPDFPEISLSSFTYDLPADRIAMFPAHPKDTSKLLCWDQGNISHHIFRDLPEILDHRHFLVFNNTRVIPARLLFPAGSDRTIEVFLLNPLNPHWTAWECQIGGRKKFREDMELRVSTGHEGKELWLTASWISRDRNEIRLNCTDGYSIAEALDIFGKTPLPPYIKRAANAEDVRDYQTVFARNPGAVAAPTASLHFTPEVLLALKEKNIGSDYLTLHVGLGTFKPVTAATAAEHDMHAERYVVTAEFLDKLLNASDTIIVAGGTTAMRLLESLYFAGAGVLSGRESPLAIEKDAGFDADLKQYETQQALAALRDMAVARGGFLEGSTAIFIVPGFDFRICSGLITNFHQPGSTLLLLVAAFVGEDWRKLYDTAMSGEYRFLSYGDASLLLKGA